ncbi:MAG: TVP38/TMEM64 family protein [Suipraeoptans sp.]
MKTIRKNIKLIIFVGIILLVLILNYIFGWSDYLGNMDNLAFLKEMLKDNFEIALLIYMGITILGCVVLALPGVTFAIIAGMLFGPLWGTVACSLSTTIGAILAFIAGRFFLKDSIKPLVMKNKYLKKMLFDNAGKNDIFILMITRLVPIFPYNLQNFAYGVTDISLGKYSLFSFIFMIPGTAMYTIGAAGITNAENRWICIGAAVVIAVVVIGVSRILKKKYVGDDN